MPRPRPRTDRVEDPLKSPLRVRILGWLAGKSQPRTKREIGRALSLSNAGVHYHLKKLERAGMVKLEGTRPGPNSITEKLYSAKPVTEMTESKDGAMSVKEKREFYLRYTFDSIREVHREAEELIKSNWKSNRFLAGCYGVHATEQEIRKLKDRLLRTLEEFQKKHKKPRKGTRPIAMTLGLVPSSGLSWGTTEKVLDMLRVFDTLS